MAAVVWFLELVVALLAVDAPPPARAGAFVVEVCDWIYGIDTVDLGGGDADEIVVGCEDGVHVLWLDPRTSAIVERTHIRTRAPQGQQAIARDYRVTDVDGDGR